MRLRSRLHLDGSGPVQHFYNRPFYRYGGHIEFIRFKEYYGMLRGQEHVWYTRSVFTRAFPSNFSKTFPRKKIVIGIKDRCAVPFSREIYSEVFFLHEKRA